jgi:hypothetical protein
MHGKDWVIVTDLRDCFRSNGVNRTITPTQCSSFDRLSISKGAAYSEVSDFAVQCVLPYNRKLSIADVLRVESWLTAASLGPWSSASLTAPRYAIAVASLPQIRLAIFASGTSTSRSVLENYRDAQFLSTECDLLSVHTNTVLFQLNIFSLFIVPTLWTYTIESQALGAQQLSAWLDLNLRPHRCRITDLRSLLAVLVRRIVFI